MKKSSAYSLFIFLCLAMVTTIACKAKKFTKSALPPEQLIFGSGGGFTGEVQTYILLENGQLFYTSSLTKDTTEQTAVKSKEAKKLFNQAAAIDLNTNGFKQPGNMYYFLREKKGDKIYSATWGKDAFIPPANITDLYKSLNQITKK